MRNEQHDYLFLKMLGMRIRSLREQKGWSQENLSFQSGLHRTYIGAVERGERNISILNLKKISAALCVPIYQILLFGDEKLENDKKQ
jgi:transcriptional regulator with XRE-family HTH domain